MSAALWLLLAFGAVIGVGSILVLFNDALDHLVTRWRNRA